MILAICLLVAAHAHLSDMNRATHGRFKKCRSPAAALAIFRRLVDVTCRPTNLNGDNRGHGDGRRSRLPDATCSSDRWCFIDRRWYQRHLAWRRPLPAEGAYK